MANPNPQTVSSNPSQPPPRMTLTPIKNNMGPRGVPLGAVTKPVGDGKDPVIVESASLLHLPIGLSYVKTGDLDRAKKQTNFAAAFTQRIRGSKAEEWLQFPVGSPVLEEMAPVDASNPLGAMSEDAALRFIGDIKDPNTLGMLADRDKRDAVIRALREQKKQIETKGVAAVEDSRTTIGED